MIMIKQNRRRYRTPPPRKKKRGEGNVDDDVVLAFAVILTSIVLCFGFNLFLSSKSFMKKCNMITRVFEDHFEIKLFMCTIAKTLEIILKILSAYAEETLVKLHGYFFEEQRYEYNLSEPRCVYLQYVYTTAKSFETFVPNFLPASLIDGLSAYRCHESLQDKIILLAFAKFWLFMVALIITLLASLDWMFALLLLPFHALKILLYVVYCCIKIVV